MTTEQSLRVITNSDLDAIVSTVLLKTVETIGTVKFLPLSRIKAGSFSTSPVDLVVNMPYIEGCKLWFDHHDSNTAPEDFQGRYDPQAPSAARVIYDYYSNQGRAESFVGLERLLEETDRVDDGKLTADDILNPRGAVLLSFLIDSNPLETGTVSENNLMINLLKSGDPEVVLKHPVFQKKAADFLKNLSRSLKFLKKHLNRYGRLLLLDCRDMTEQEIALCTNKFLPFVIDPDSEALLRVKEHNETQLRMGLGFNIFWPEQDCSTHYGNLLAKYGGGGHARASGCAVDKSSFNSILEEIKQVFK